MRMHNMLVEEVMTKDVVSIDCNKTVFDACKIYSKLHVGCLVVMDKDIIVGIVTERDTIERVILEDKNPKKTKIRDIMSSNIKTIHALAPLEKAAKLMNEYKIKKLPVILNNEIVGIITETDLSNTIEAYSEAVQELTKFYSESKDTIEKILDEWGNILYSLKGFRNLTSINQNDEIIKEEIA
jgi:malate dehydrogenase (oxaloacetate-decarboxylating)